MPERTEGAPEKRSAALGVVMIAALAGMVIGALVAIDWDNGPESQGGSAIAEPGELEPLVEASSTAPLGPTDRREARPETPSPATTPADPTETRPRVIELPFAPSEAAVDCSRSGLVAAGLDACLRYEALGCTYWNSLPVCEAARNQLEAVQGTRIFPNDCLIMPRSESDRPAWCDVGR